MSSNSYFPIFGVLVLMGIILFLGVYFIPWKGITWGAVKQIPGNTVMVIGEAQSQKTNQMASYTAGVSAVHDDKQVAIDEVDQQINLIVDAVKELGIDDKDIKTQNISVYQMEESYWEGDRQKSRKGQWRVDNSIEVKLKDIDKAESLTQILAESGATNIYGPNYTYDDSQDAVDHALYEAAMENAVQKAEVLADLSGKQLGDVLSITEGVADNSGVYPMLRMGGGGGSGLEPGSTTVTTSLTVVFELK